MFKLSKMTDYAVVVLVRLARDDSVQTTPGIAVSTAIPEPTVAKVLKSLAGKGLVLSHRGAHGGYRLARPLSAIPVSDVITAIDGPIALTACVEGGACESHRLCLMHGRWDPVNAAIEAALSSITLADMDRAIPRAFMEPAAAAPALHGTPSPEETGAFTPVSHASL